jgi:hypothetical protein
MMRPLAVLALTCALAAPARAQIQTSGPEVWPGKLQVGVHPIGGQYGFNDNREPSGYRGTVDIAGLLKQFDQVSLWLGGGVGFTHGGFVACAGCDNQVDFWVFVELSLEKLFNIPLVPFFRAGPGGGVLLYTGDNNFGMFTFRVGSGIHYFLTKNIGLGAEMNINLGAGFFNDCPAGVQCRFGGTEFFGTWDGELGARFAF